MASQKIRIAIIKYGGLSAGGTEKFLQTVAVNLPKVKFSVTYFYCDATAHIGADFSHPTTDPHRQKYLENAGIKLVKFKVGAKDLTTPTHVWRNTDFWEVFKEADFDLIQTGRGGYLEYPFTHIKKTPIVDSIHLSAGADNQYNIARVMHICNWNAEKWIKSGGDKSRVVLISHPMSIDNSRSKSLRVDYNLDSKTMIYGFHQRDADSIFSPIPLAAYKQIETPHTHFMLLGGSSLYRQQAKDLAIKNISFIDHSANPDLIYSFLMTLNVYTHGRKDGEVNSTAMAEALYFGLPIVSHRSSVNNGHVECIDEAGVVVEDNDVPAYARELVKLRDDTDYYAKRSEAAKQRFAENYELTGQMKRIENIYESVIADPFPHPLRRILYSLHWTQNVRIWLKWAYLKTKYLINGKV